MLTFLRYTKRFGRAPKLEIDPVFANTMPEERKKILDDCALQLADLRRANDAELASRRRFEDERQAQTLKPKTAAG